MNKESADKNFLSENNFQLLIVVCCELIFIGFVFSRALVSIGMISLLAISLLQNGILTSFKKYFERKELWILSFFFLIVFVSGIYSDNKSDLLNWVRIKLPYIALPLAFAPLKKLEERNFILILYGFIATFFVSVSIVLANYFLNYKEITESFLRGNAIPMPYSHIRYTLMLAFSFFACFYLLETRKSLRNANEKYLQLFFLVFSFLALHILAVRSSLLALYAGIFFLAVRFFISRKNIFQGIIFLLLVVLAPFVALKYVPSLQNKFGYMRYDLAQFRERNFNNLSDGIRLLSMKGGWEIARENLLFGVGAGDLKNEMESFYLKNFPQLSETDRKPLHNQFLWVFASTGAIGLSLFLVAFFFPLFYRSSYKHWLFAVFHLILFSSFFTEATLEEQMGTGFYLIFLVVFLNKFQRE